MFCANAAASILLFTFSHHHWLNVLWSLGSGKPGVVCLSVCLCVCVCVRECVCVCLCVCVCVFFFHFLSFDVNASFGQRKIFVSACQSINTLKECLNALTKSIWFKQDHALVSTKQNFSRAWFRSTDLWVMGPARFHCATLLAVRRCWNKHYISGSESWARCHKRFLMQSFIDHLDFDLKK